MKLRCDSSAALQSVCARQVVTCCADATAGAASAAAPTPLATDAWTNFLLDNTMARLLGF
jgi:hypothetical protein